MYKSVLVPSASVATDPVKVFRTIGRHVGVALLLSFHPVGLRCDAPVEDLVAIQDVEYAQRSLALHPSGTGVLYVHAPPHTRGAILFESLYHTDPRLGRFSLPPIRDLSYYEPQARLDGEGRVGRSVALCRRQLFSLLLLDNRTSVSD